MKKILKSQEGSTFVEAAIVMPVVILAMISVVLIMVFVTYVCTYQVDIHKKLLEESGNRTETRVTYDKTNRDYMLEDDYANGKAVVKTQKEVVTSGGGLLNSKLKGSVQSRVYEIDEKEIIRYSDFFKEQIKQ